MANRRPWRKDYFAESGTIAEAQNNYECTEAFLMGVGPIPDQDEGPTKPTSELDATVTLIRSWTVKHLFELDSAADRFIVESCIFRGAYGAQGGPKGAPPTGGELATATKGALAGAQNNWLHLLEGGTITNGDSGFDIDIRLVRHKAQVCFPQSPVISQSISWVHLREGELAWHAFVKPIDGSPAADYNRQSRFKSLWAKRQRRP